MRIRVRGKTGRPAALALWELFGSLIEAGIVQTNALGEECVWEAFKLGPWHLRVQLAGHPNSYSVDMEYFPGLWRVVCVFKPAGRLRVFEFEGAPNPARGNEPEVTRLPAPELADSMLDLVLFSGED